MEQSGAAGGTKTEDWEGPDFKTCANAANVARAFELSRRRDNLPVDEIEHWQICRS